MITGIFFAIDLKNTALKTDASVIELQHRLMDAAQQISGADVGVSILAYEGQLDDREKQNAKD